MIDPQAVIHPTAKIAEGVSIGPGSLIGADVTIGKNTWIGPQVVIQGPTIIGENNKIYQFSSIGNDPQDLTYKGEATHLEIGDNNIIREYCMISRGTTKGGGLTRIGNNNFLMCYSHIGHDCIVKNHIIMTSYAALSGHVTVDDYAIIGGYAAIHQFCCIGSHAFVARATYVGKDVLPYTMIAGYTSAACGINTVGLKRRGFSSAAIDNLRRAYKIVFRKGFTQQQALAELEAMQEDCPEVTIMIESLRRATRGIVR